MLSRHVGAVLDPSWRSPTISPLASPLRRRLHDQAHPEAGTMVANESRDDRRGRLYKAIVRPAALYDCETWPTSAETQRRFATAELTSDMAQNCGTCCPRKMNIGKNDH